MTDREVVEQIQARATSDGDGVKLLRVFGGARPERFDPFLMMDEFGSESADDYIGGFPSHPHRGFETITYMLQGKMEHRDHMENVGLISDGDVQWMTAGRGVIHSEMPKQTEGKMRGFQVWLNLDADKKMRPAWYKDVPAKDIPIYTFEGTSIKAIAGTTAVNGQQEIKGHFDIVDTRPLYLDIHLQAGAKLSLQIENSHTALLYVYDGELSVGSKNVVAVAQYLNRLGEGDTLSLHNPGFMEARAVLLAGVPIKQPIVQYGPFVMNTEQEINQAVKDYRDGVLTG